MVQVKKQSAFTLMEILIVMVVIGILATLLGPRIGDAWDKIKKNQSLGAMANIETALQNYQEDVGTYPTTKEGLEALVEPPRDSKKASRWKGSYFKGSTDVPKDGWKNDFDYNCPPARFKKECKRYEIICFGSDGEESNDDFFIGE